MEVNKELIYYVLQIWNRFDGELSKENRVVNTPRGLIKTSKSDNDIHTERLAAYLTIAYMLKYNEKGPYMCEICGFRTFMAPPDNTCPHCQQRGSIVAYTENKE